MPSPELEPLLRALAAEFDRRDMPGHVELLRNFYARYRAAKKRANLAPKPVWEIDLVLQWLAMLRIPPFDRAYEERPAEAGCPTCTADGAGISGTCTRTAINGLTLSACIRCGAEWLVVSEIRKKVE